MDFIWRMDPIDLVDSVDPLTGKSLHEEAQELVAQSGWTLKAQYRLWLFVESPMLIVQKEAVALLMFGITRDDFISEPGTTLFLDHTRLSLEDYFQKLSGAPESILPREFRELLVSSGPSFTLVGDSKIFRLQMYDLAATQERQQELNRQTGEDEYQDLVRMELQTIRMVMDNEAASVLENHPSF